MSRSTAENHLKEIQSILKEFERSYDDMNQLQKDRLKQKAHRALSTFDEVIRYVHNTDD
jgi:hypothetical protein